MAFTFEKSERLCSKNHIAQLFSKGNRGFTLFPFRFSWIPVQVGAPVQVIIVVSKRNFSKASQRNLVKRQLRELYRSHKHLLSEALSGKDARYALMIAYISKEKRGHIDLLNIFHQSILRFKSELEKTDSGSIYPADQIL